jgi:EAL domain-containing protein (putative c-di-GMP-specific phosphodiesterase class I)
LFIARIGQEQEYETIVKAIIDLCHALGRRVVAGGVETARQLAFLTAHGCDEVQGFLFCPPLPAHEVEEYLRRPAPGTCQRGDSGRRPPVLVNRRPALSG